MNPFTLFGSGVKAFEAVEAALADARESISLEVYIFGDDGTGRRIRERLTAAAGQGVRVRVLVDGWGSWSLPAGFWHPLSHAGGQVRVFNALRRGFLSFRDHRKLLVVDGRTAFLGGMNIGDEYRLGRDGAPPWRDNMLRLEREGVSRLVREFDTMWDRAARPFSLKRFLKARLGERESEEGSRVRFLTGGPDDPVRPLRREYRDLLRRANRSIDLAMSYFYPPGVVLRSLKRASSRGVRVRLLVPGRNDVALARWACHGLYGRLLRGGIQVWEYLPGVLHAKLTVADDEVLIGSANLDQRSERINFELAALLADRDLSERARADFEEDLKVSRRVRFETWRRRPWWVKLGERLAYLILARLDVLWARLERSRETL